MIESATDPRTKKVLFLCSGNYYRSRFAEEVFNRLAEGQGLAWRAESRGLGVGRHGKNIGPISIHALRGLAALGIDLKGEIRMPQKLLLEDLESADVVIAVKQAEHRDMLQEQFPDWVSRVEFWHVHDLDAATPDVALAELESLVRELQAKLRTLGSELNGAA
jgi:protein-tyrosine phosphatase